MELLESSNKNSVKVVASNVNQRTLRLGIYAGNYDLKLTNAVDELLDNHKQNAASGLVSAGWSVGKFLLYDTRAETKQNKSLIHDPMSLYVLSKCQSFDSFRQRLEQEVAHTAQGELSVGWISNTGQGHVALGLGKSSVLCGSYVAKDGEQESKLLEILCNGLQSVFSFSPEHKCFVAEFSNGKGLIKIHTEFLITVHKVKEQEIGSDVVKSLKKDYELDLGWMLKNTVGSARRESIHGVAVERLESPLKKARMEEAAQKGDGSESPEKTDAAWILKEQERARFAAKESLGKHCVINNDVELSGPVVPGCNQVSKSSTVSSSGF